jgi:hypothetical protein
MDVLRKLDVKKGKGARHEISLIKFFPFPCLSTFFLKTKNGSKEMAFFDIYRQFKPNFI